jgi:hypothetical protein
MLNAHPNTKLLFQKMLLLIIIQNFISFLKLITYLTLVREKKITS